MGEPIFPVDGILYADESHYTGSHRYRSLACVSVASHSLGRVDNTLRDILVSEGITDLGFTDLRSVRNCRAAVRLLRSIAEFAASGVLQVRTLVWDAYDSRHGFGTDDLRNLERMYVHLLRDVMGRRWQARSWEIRPDEQSAVRWNTLSRIAEAAASKTAGRDIEVRHLEEQSSAREPLIQVADLYAGLTAYYAENGVALSRFRALQEDQQQASIEQRVHPVESNAAVQRAKLIPYIITLHDEQRIHASFSRSGLILGDSVGSPIYTWRYEPQSAEDKAPRRGADNEVATFLFICSENGCADVVELSFHVETPYCKQHYFERNQAKIQRKIEREDRREAERLYREGSHYCDRCFHRVSPSSEDVARATYINRRPQCPACGAWSLLSASGGSRAPENDLDERLREFEQRHDDRWR